jgi:hypothetical protein
MTFKATKQNGEVVTFNALSLFHAKRYCLAFLGFIPVTVEVK